MEEKKRNHFMRMAAVLMAFAFLVGCGGGDDPDSPIPNPPDPTNPTNPTDPTDPTNPGGQKYCKTASKWEKVWVSSRSSSGTTFLLNTNLKPDDFTLSSSESWCTVRVETTPTPNLLGLVILVEEYNPLEENGAYRHDPPRTATIQIASGTLFNESITVAQNCKVGFRSSLGGLPLKISAGGESKEVIIITNCYSWTPSSLSDWLTVQCKDNSTLIVTSKERPATQSIPGRGAFSW